MLKQYHYNSMLLVNEGLAKVGDTLKAALESQAAEIEKYKALCGQMAYAMEMHGAPFLHHELRYTEALEAWRAMK